MGAGREDPWNTGPRRPGLAGKPALSPAQRPDSPPGPAINSQLRGAPGQHPSRAHLGRLWPWPWPWPLGGRASGQMRQLHPPASSSLVPVTGPSGSGILRPGPRTHPNAQAAKLGPTALSPSQGHPPGGLGGTCSPGTAPSPSEKSIFIGQEPFLAPSQHPPSPHAARGPKGETWAVGALTTPSAPRIPSQSPPPTAPRAQPTSLTNGCCLLPPMPSVPSPSSLMPFRVQSPCPWEGGPRGCQLHPHHAELAPGGPPLVVDK